jgi:hypothetical protein
VERAVAVSTALLPAEHPGGQSHAGLSTRHFNFNDLHTIPF